VIDSRGWPPAPVTQIPVAARRVTIDFRSSNGEDDRLLLERTVRLYVPARVISRDYRGCLQTHRATKPFSPGLRYKLGQMGSNEPGPMGVVRLGGFEATWPGLLSRPRIRPGPKGRDERPVFY
jgi:hypothetical protein